MADMIHGKDVMSLRPPCSASLVLPALLSMGFLAGCEENVRFATGGRVGESNAAYLRIEPTEHAFGRLTSKDEGKVTFTVTNTGYSVLMIDELSLDGSESFSIAPSTELPFLLDPQATWTFDAYFQPVEGGDLGADVTIWSTDAEQPSVQVPLKGKGALPRLEITPDPVDFRTFSVPCVKDETVTLTNTGVEPLRITDVSIGGANPAGLVLRTNLPSGLELSQNQSFDMRIELPAEGPENVVGEVVVQSSDPRGEQSVDVLATTRYIADGETIYTVPPQSPVHFIFAVDQSGSMVDDQQRLASNFSSFITTLQAANADWRVGVVTGAGASNGACFNGGNWITPTTANATSVFTTRVQQGDDSSPNTEKLMALVDSAIAMMDTGECNAGFTAGNGPLHIIVVSDERDQSASQNVGGYLNAWRARAGSGQRLAVHGVIDLDTTPPSPADCGGYQGDDGPGIYDDAVLQTGGILFDLCTSNWATALSTIAQSAIVDRRSVEVDDRNPHEPSIEVYIDGVKQTAGWSYDPARNAIDFATDLPNDSEVRIRYGIAPNCP